MRYCRNSLLRMSAASILIALAGCSMNGNQAGAAAKNPIVIFETEQGFSVAEGEEQVLFYQRQHKSMDGKYTRANKDPKGKLQSPHLNLFEKIRKSNINHAL